MKLVVSRAAGRDLDAIFDYTVEHWGIEQAGRYVGSFDLAFGTLRRYPELGRPSVRPSGYRRLRHESHFIFYRIRADVLHIERIFHVRMQIPRHLA